MAWPLQVRERVDEQWWVEECRHKVRRVVVVVVVWLRSLEEWEAKQRPTLTERLPFTVDSHSGNVGREQRTPGPRDAHLISDDLDLARGGEQSKSSTPWKGPLHGHWVQARREGREEKRRGRREEREARGERKETGEKKEDKEDGEDRGKRRVESGERRE